MSASTSVTVVLVDEPMRKETTAVAGFLAGYCGNTRRSYATDLRLFSGWCHEANLTLFDVRRAHLELYGRWMEETGRMRSTVARRLSTLASFYKPATPPTSSRRSSPAPPAERHGRRYRAPVTLGRAGYLAGRDVPSYGTTGRPLAQRDHRYGARVMGELVSGAGRRAPGSRPQEAAARRPEARTCHAVRDPISGRSISSRWNNNTPGNTSKWRLFVTCPVGASRELALTPPEAPPRDEAGPPCGRAARRAG